MEFEKLNGKFELVKAKNKVQGEEYLCFLCRNETHKYRLSKEDADVRGVGEKWEKDDLGGFIWATSPMQIGKMEKKCEIYRAKKRPKIVKSEIIILMCPECGSGARFFLDSSESILMQEY